ncbi:MAG TPA: TldD/PmbA family protein [Amycolatopsis sp.]|nr:TldD/PmbA family protein [Amycolatopsis sp.]
MRAEIDESFGVLPHPTLADAALTRARDLGATHAQFRLDRVRTARSFLRDGDRQGSQDETDIGIAVRVLRRGAWGFAASTRLTPAAAVGVAEEAVAVADAVATLGGRRAEPVEEPVYHNEVWASAPLIDPFSVPEEDRVAILREWTGRLRAAPEIDQVLAKLVVTRENKFYADLAGTVTLQQRVRLHPQLLVSGHDSRAGRSVSLRTVGPPTARGLEYLSGQGWDWDGELAALPAQLAEKLRAEPVEPGHHDLVLDPSHLWLTVHESVGHATELDRALGHEISYAGTTFATPAGLGSLRYGSSQMNVRADRTVPHGLATIGFDDEGVAARSWNLVEDGVLTGFQFDRSTAAAIGAPGSAGCAFAESARHLPLSRMPNVSLLPAPGGPSTDELISAVGEGIYLAGSDSFSIDPRRETFQFSAQRAHRIHRGRLVGQLAGVAYQARTVDFWAALSALGGERSYRLFGADLCGKGQPLQVAAASHGCPGAVFSGIRVVDTAGTGAR